MGGRKPFKMALQNSRKEEESEKAFHYMTRILSLEKKNWCRELEGERRPAHLRHLQRLRYPVKIDGTPSWWSAGASASSLLWPGSSALPSMFSPPFDPSRMDLMYVCSHSLECCRSYVHLRVSECWFLGRFSMECFVVMPWLLLSLWLSLRQSGALLWSSPRFVFLHFYLQLPHLVIHFNSGGKSIRVV